MKSQIKFPKRPSKFKFVTKMLTNTEFYYKKRDDNFYNILKKRA